MKKTLPILIVLTLLLSAALTLAACNSSHEHRFTAWEVTEAATCSAEGVKTRTCKDCGEVETGVVEKLAHTPLTEGAVPATCTEAGQSGTVKCEVCGVKISDSVVIPALGHAMSENFEHGIENTEAEQKRHYHFKYCTRDGCGHVDRTYCELVETTVAATCDEDGFKKLECGVCHGGEVLEVYEKLGHAWGEYTYNPATGTHRRVCGNDSRHVDQGRCAFVDKDFVDATCTEAGYTVRECTYCHGTKDVPSAEHPAKGHDYGDWVVDKQATCAAAGSQHKDCKNCDDVVTEEIKQRDHIWSEPSLYKAATCTEVGEKRSECRYDDCDEVKSEEIEMLPHDYDAWEVETDSTCTSEGVQRRKCKGKDCNHEEEGVVAMKEHEKQIIPKVDPKCEEDGSTEGEECKNCHTILKAPTRVPATGHNYNGAEYHTIQGERRHYRLCQNKDCDHRDEEGCDPRVERHEATCVDAGYTEYICRDCSDSYRDGETPAKGHSMSSPTPVYMEENGADHVHKHVQVCLRAGCGHSVESECSMSEAGEMEPTCTKAGYTKMVCSECGSVHENVTSDALGHTYRYSYILNTYPYMHTARCQRCNYKYNEYCAMTYVENKPTCTTIGETRGTCEHCYHSVRRGNYVSALGHNYGPWTYDGDMSENHTHYRECLRDGCTAETEGHVQRGECHIVTTETLPTCEAAGGKVTACDVCLTSISESSVEALGHKYGAWKIDDKKGEHYHLCNTCGAEERYAHEKIVDTYDATCTDYAKTVTTCRVCDYSLVEEDRSNPINGHNYQVDVSDEHQHVARCLNCNEQHSGAHDYSVSNLCSYCQYDGLTYVKMGAHYIVKSDDNIISFRPKKIIIPAYHSEYGSDESLPVREIARNAFQNNRYIEEVVLPVTLEVINDSAFMSCTGIKSVSIEGDETGALHTIGAYAFTKCESLVAFEAPTTLETIGAGAFENCLKLVDIKIHDDVKSIGAGAFSNTAYLNIDANWTGNVLYIGKHLIKGRATVVDDKLVTDVEVRDGTVSINSSAFLNMDITSIVLPDSLKIIESRAFEGCTHLSKVEFKGDMQAWFEIEFKDELASPLYYDAALHIDAAHDRIVIPTGVTRIPVGTFRGTEITEVIIPDTVTYIGADAFEDCALLAKIQIPTSVTYIGRDAFKNCLYFNTPDNWENGNALYIDTHLIATKAEAIGTEFVVKEGTTTIGIEAFKDCVNLTKVTIAADVLRIGEGAFSGCAALTDVVFLNLTDGWLGSGRVMRFVDPASLADPKGARAQFDTYYGEWKRLQNRA